MKVTNLRRKLMAALAAGGTLAPGAAYAANLNENLVANSGFEDVDINTIIGGSVKFNNWAAGPNVGFAYSHNGALNGMGNVIPDYANGGPLVGGGSYYFNPNASNATQPDIDEPGMVMQNIDVSTGPSGTLIASGNARYSLSGFFSGYLGNGDFGTVHAEFLNGSNASLGTATASTQNVHTWTPAGETGLIPVGTATVRVSIFATALSGGPDGYIDNVGFRIGNEAIMPTLEVTIDRGSGSISLANRTGGAANLKSYSITSAFEAMNPANWQSIADNFDAGSPGPNQVDGTHNWSELTDAASHGDLSEAELDAADGATLAHTRIIPIGSAGAWIQNPNEDLVFQYISGAEIKQGIVRFTGNGGVPFELGDIVNPGSGLTVADWMTLRTNQHTNLSALSLAEAYRLGDLNGDHLNDHADFVLFKAAFDEANGAGAFATMLASVPEPTTALLVMAGGLLALPIRRRFSAT